MAAKITKINEIGNKDMLKTKKNYQFENRNTIYMTCFS